MDTDAIYSAVCSYGTAKHHGWESDAEDTLSEIKRLLNEADAERQELLATNERLVDEVAELKAAYESQFKELHELKAKLTDKASLLRGCYARINVLEKALTAAHDHIDMAALKVSHCKDAAIIRAALEKKQ